MRLFDEAALIVSWAAANEGLFEIGILKHLPDARGHFWPTQCWHAEVEHDQAEEGLLVH